MSTNLFSRLQALLPPSPLLIARVIEVHSDDTSTVSLPINAGDTVLSPGLSQGRLLRVRGSQVPAGGNAFVRDGLIESRAPDGDPVLIVIGEVAPTPPTTRQLALNGTIPAQVIQVGDAYTLDLRPFWKDGFAPFAYTHTGTLPAGLTFVGANGQITGAPTTPGVSTITPACTDVTSRRVQQAGFTITVLLPAYWEPAGGSVWTLTNSDRTAAVVSGFGVRTVGCNVQRSTGVSQKRYFEIRYVTSGAFGDGVRDEYGMSRSVAGNEPSVQGIGYRRTGSIRVEGSLVTTGSTLSANDVLGFAVDLSTRKVWVSLNGAWVGGGDPAAGTGEIGTLPAGTYQPHASSESGSPCTVTLNASASNLVYSPPAGFTAWST
jgi:hypothetical protein